MDINKLRISRPMNAKEILENLPSAAILMIEETVKAARAAITGKNIYSREPKETPEINKVEVEMAASILHTVFYEDKMSIMETIVNMPAEYDGIHLPVGESYAELFIKGLCRELGVSLILSD